MLSQLSVLAHKVGNNAYHFLCDPNSPLPEIKDALFQFTKYVGQIEDQAKAQADAAAQSAVPVVEQAVEAVVTPEA